MDDYSDYPLHEFDVRCEGRKWSSEEFRHKWRPHPEVPERIEVLDGKVFHSDGQRLTMLGWMLERLLADIKGSLGLPEFEFAFAPADPYLKFEARSFEVGHPATPPGTGRDAPRGDLVSLEGRLDHRPIMGTELRFDFVSDRSRLQNTARGLRHVLATFPDRIGGARGG